MEKQKYQAMIQAVCELCAENNEPCNASVAAEFVASDRQVLPGLIQLLEHFNPFYIRSLYKALIQFSIDKSDSSFAEAMSSFDSRVTYFRNDSRYKLVIKWLNKTWNF